MIYLTAKWCAPCKALKPKIEKLGGVTILDIDTPEGARVAGIYDIQGVPRLVLDNDMVINPAELPWASVKKMIEEAS